MECVGVNRWTIAAAAGSAAASMLACGAKYSTFQIFGLIAAMERWRV